MSASLWRVVVVGGIAGGMSAAVRAKRGDPDLDIIVVERGPCVSCGGCGIPHVLSGVVPDSQALIVYTPEYFRTHGDDRI